MQFSLWFSHKQLYKQLIGYFQAAEEACKGTRWLSAGGQDAAVHAVIQSALKLIYNSQAAASTWLNSNF